MRRNVPPSAQVSGPPSVDSKGLKPRECFSKWILEYSQHCPSLVNYCTKLQNIIKRPETRHYHFPERSVDISKFLVLRADWRADWHAFVELIKDPFVLDSKVLLGQVDFLDSQIRRVERESRQLSDQPQDSQLRDLSTQKELISYIRHLEEIVVRERDEAAEDSRPEEARLRVQKKFWECLEKQFNHLFAKPISLANKIQSISKKIEEIETEEKLKQIEDEYRQMEASELEKEEQSIDKTLFEVDELEREVEDIEWQKQQIQVR